MTLSSINANSNNAYQQILQQRRQQELDALTQAVQAGDIGSAQKALTTLKGDDQATQAADTPDASRKAYEVVSAFFVQNETDAPVSVAAGSGDDFGTQIDTLFKAIAKGDLTGAQSALTSLQSLISAQTQLATTTSGSDDDALGKSLDSLFDAVKSGDASKAQAALQAIDSAGGFSVDGTDGTQSTVDKDLQALFAAVKTGDMKTAQSAMQSLDQDLDAAKLPPPPPPEKMHHQHKTLFKDLSAVFDAVEKGDISAAQTSLSTWQSDKAAQASDKSATTAPLPPASQAYFETLDGQ